MIDYECSRCGGRGRVAGPDQLSQPCSGCRADATWAALPAETRRLVEEELARGRMLHGIKALRDAHPSIPLAHAIEVVARR
ncbi:hypothetical protein [Actinoplanes sp. NPDC049681]|uniref:hypothetical protein n=1 Tax=Actinoplanes sp. NPDC049681 TaxID=3363905 RepID=UPI0037971970